jgi:hypothetical protein
MNLRADEVTGVFPRGALTTVRKGEDMGNSLEDYIAQEMHEDEVTVINILQDHGVVSDEAVHAKDVHNAGVAVAWIHRNPQFFRRGLVKTKRR